MPTYGHERKNHGMKSIDPILLLGDTEKHISGESVYAS